eukprot:2385262-Pyramimonas_sp.AAC.1
MQREKQHLACILWCADRVFRYGLASRLARQAHLIIHSAVAVRRLLSVRRDPHALERRPR